LVLAEVVFRYRPVVLIAVKLKVADISVIAASRAEP